MTGSIRTRDLSRRGWLRERRDLQTWSEDIDGIRSGHLQLGAAHAVAYSHNWVRYRVLLLVDQIHQISGMIRPTSCEQLVLSLLGREVLTIISEYSLIDNTRLALIPHIRYPNRPDAQAILG
jgi:hypothetical protein